MPKYFSDISESEWIIFAQVVQKLDKTFDYPDALEILIANIEKRTGNKSFIAMAQAVNAYIEEMNPLQVIKAIQEHKNAN